MTDFTVQDNRIAVGMPTMRLRAIVEWRTEPSTLAATVSAERTVLNATEISTAKQSRIQSVSA